MHNVFPHPKTIVLNFISILKVAALFLFLFSTVRSLPNTESCVKRHTFSKDVSHAPSDLKLLSIT